MIRINQIKIGIDKKESDLMDQISKVLRVKKEEIKKYSILRKSIDARKKNDLQYIYSVLVEIKNEEAVVKRINKADVTIHTVKEYKIMPSGIDVMKNRPVVVGMGPAGLFAGLMLARAGYNPILIERGKCVEERVEDVELFWKEGILNSNSNVQFGEGGAGTFSDGKINTLVRDDSGRNNLVLKTFVEFGAPDDILYMNKPHIGTDKLRNVVVGIRNEIIKLGGEVRFNTCLTNFRIEKNQLVGIELNGEEQLACDNLVLAVGHSARDTFSVIKDKGFDISAKSFAVGLRIEHPQEVIGKSQYGVHYTELPTAEYKVTHQASTGRGVYSFCMCPGGFVVNSSSEEGRLVVNGMSNHARDEKNANSAIIVTVTPEDFGDTDNPLAGVEFQRKLEELAYKEGNGKIPVQRFEDYAANRISKGFGKVKPNTKGAYSFGNLNHCLPKELNDSITEAIYAYNRMIPGFSDGDSLLLGVESRTSSPIRIQRDEEFESNIQGIYPCGEGAGYAGGITSAAMDGIKVYEAMAKKYKSYKTDK